MRKKRSFIYVGEKSPLISDTSNTDFYLVYQNAILNSLLKRGLLSREQVNLCMEDILKRNQRKCTVNV